MNIVSRLLLYILMFSQACFAEKLVDFSEMVGETSFSQQDMPKGVSREQWYEQLLEKQERFIKAELLDVFARVGINFEEYKLKAVQKICSWEDLIKNQKANLIGWWQKNEQGAVVEGCGQDENSWYIATEGLDFVRLQSEILGLQGYLIMSEPNNFSMAQAYYQSVTVMPTLFNKHPIQQLYVLCHEMSHIKHQDYVWHIAIELILFASICTGELKRKLKGLLDLLKLFCERRADLEGLFTLRKTDFFQDNIKQLSLFQGYPKTFKVCTKYSYEAKVNYIFDFFQGLARDYQLHLAVLASKKHHFKGLNHR